MSCTLIEFFPHLLYSHLLFTTEKALWMSCRAVFTCLLCTDILKIPSRHWIQLWIIMNDLRSYPNSDHPSSNFFPVCQLTSTNGTYRNLHFWFFHSWQMPMCLPLQPYLSHFPLKKKRIFWSRFIWIFSKDNTPSVSHGQGFAKLLSFFVCTWSEQWRTHLQVSKCMTAIAITPPQDWNHWNSFNNLNHHIQSTNGILVSKSFDFQEYHPIFQPRSNREIYGIFRDTEQNSVLLRNTMRYYGEARR